ncbi:MAG: hypothetical protein ABW185_19580 [Sedimenticola sp.]
MEKKEKKEKEKEYAVPSKSTDSDTVFKLSIQRQFEEQKQLNKILKDQLTSLTQCVKVAQTDIFDGKNSIKTMDSISKVEKFKPDIHEPIIFWDRFRLFATYKEWDDAKSILMFPYFLDDYCFQWCQQLPAGGKDTIVHLKESFLKKFSNKEENQWVVFNKLAQRTQKTDENVADYIKEVLYMCRQVNESEEHQRRKVIAGLLPEIKSFVITKEPKTMDDVERCAKIAENMQASGGSAKNMPDGNKLDYLTRMVEELKLKDTHEVMGIDENRSRAQKRVTFQSNDISGDNSGARSAYTRSPERVEYQRPDSREMPRYRERSISPWTRREMPQYRDRSASPRNRRDMPRYDQRSTSPWNGRLNYNTRSRQSEMGDGQIPQNKCTRCGKYNCIPYSCPALNVKCFYCKAIGHYEQCCRKKHHFLARRGAGRRN